MNWSNSFKRLQITLYQLLTALTNFVVALGYKPMGYSVLLPILVSGLDTNSPYELLEDNMLVNECSLYMRRQIGGSGGIWADNMYSWGEFGDTEDEIELNNGMDSNLELKVDKDMGLKGRLDVRINNTQIRKQGGPKHKIICQDINEGETVRALNNARKQECNNRIITTQKDNNDIEAQENTTVRRKKRGVSLSSLVGSRGDRSRKKRKSYNEEVFGGDGVEKAFNKDDYKEYHEESRENNGIFWFGNSKEDEAQDTRIFTCKDVMGDERFIALKGLWKGKVEDVFLVCIYGPHIRNVKASLRGWSKDRFGGHKEKIEVLKKEAMRWELEAERRTLTEMERSTWLETRKRWVEMENEYGNMIRQKARIKWDVEGDENSKFFHSYVNRRNNKSNIKGLVINGVWSEDPKLIKMEMARHYKPLFSEEREARPIFCSDRLEKISEDDARVLENEFSGEEVWEAIRGCGGDKAPVLDGFNFKFIRIF
ncbi:hypothetical protein Tco_0995298 [Tanacetum coccineum]